MIGYSSVFYGDLSNKGYKISFLLMSRRIKHEFILYDDYYFIIKSLEREKELSGFEKIRDYIERYQYLLDFPEVNSWY